MTVDIKDIIAEYDKLQNDDSYRDDFKNNSIQKYSASLRGYTGPKDTSFKKNMALVILVSFIKEKRLEDLLNNYYYNSYIQEFKNVLIASPFINNTAAHNWYNLVDYFNYTNITGVTKKTTKKSLDFLSKAFVDKLFETKGIKKRNIPKEGKKAIVIKDLNDFTLTMFKEAFKPNSLALTEVQRIFKLSKTEELPLEWSNAIFSAVKPSKASYRYLYDRTNATDAEIFKHIIVLGEKHFYTPVEDYHRWCETDKITLTTTTDLSNISTDIVTKAAIETPTNSPIYNHLVEALQGTKAELLTYIDKLQTISNDINF